MPEAGSSASGPSSATPSSRTAWAIEVISAIVLSAAGLVTSWSAFQSSLWDGEQAAHYTQANAVRISASEASMLSDTEKNVDLQLFSQWLNARASSDVRLETFYRDRFRPEFRPAFEAWLALKPVETPGAPATPFVMPQYRLKADGESVRLEQKSDALFEKGQHANEISDSFVRSTVILSMAMFLAGIGQTFKTTRVRLVLIVLAALACAVGAVRVLALPILSVG